MEKRSPFRNTPAFVSVLSMLLICTVALGQSIYPVEDGIQESFISGALIGEIAVAERLDIEIHANFMASRTFDNDTVLNWYNMGYSGGGNDPVGGNFGDFGLQFPHYERDERYPQWVEHERVTAVSFDGSNSMRGDFPPEKGVAGDGDFSLEVWVLNEEPADGEVILGWECAEGAETSSPLHWPGELEGSSRWRHIAVNVTGDEEVLYIDGERIAAGDRNMRIGEEHVMVLGGASMDEPSFSGFMVTVRLHNDVLEEEEIIHNYEGGPMLGTTVFKNVDPNVSEDATDFFAEAWGKPDTGSFHTDTSQHFRARVHRSEFDDSWDDGRRKDYLEMITEQMKLAEATFNVLSERMARRMPLVSAKPEFRGDGIKYKTPIQAAPGAFMGWNDALGFGYGTQPRGDFNPHELVHGVQAQTGGAMVGQYWETDANFPQTYTGIYQSIPASVTSNTAPLYEAHGRDYYHSRNTFEHLSQSDEYGPMFISKLWYDGEEHAYPWHTFEKYNPNPETSLAYELGRMVQRNVTWDYEIFSGYNEQPEDLYRNDYERGKPRTIRHGHILLREIPHKEGWFRPQKEVAPLQTGWNIAPLEILSREVTVELEGYINPERGSGWRMGFVAVNNSGEPRYSDLIPAGKSLTFELKEDETELYLTVAGTPEEILHIDWGQSFHSPATEPFVYRVKIDGAEPRNTLWEYYEEEYAIDGKPGTEHPNGGGFVAQSASVTESVYVASDARVLGNSELSGDARIKDRAIINNSTVRDSAVVSGQAVVTDGSVVRDNAIVTGEAKVLDAVIEDFARIRDRGKVVGSSVSDFAKVAEHGTARAPVSSRAVIKGYAYAHGGSIGGNAMVDGSYSKANELTQGRWSQWSWDTGIADGENDEDFKDLYTDISFDRGHPWMAWDDFNLTWGFRINDAVSVEDEEKGTVLELNDIDQFIELPSSVADQIEMTLSIDVMPENDNPGQPVFDFGFDSDNRFYFTPSNEDGQAELVLKVDGERDSITCDNALIPEKWAQVTVTVDLEEGTHLFINDQLVGHNEAISMRPLLSQNNYFTNYLGRCQDGESFFHGHLDSFKVYTSASPPLTSQF